MAKYAYIQCLIPLNSLLIPTIPLFLSLLITEGGLKLFFFGTVLPGEAMALWLVSILTEYIFVPTNRVLNWK